jgi:ubiquitin-conjugating enzyme E2 S
MQSCSDGSFSLECIRRIMKEVSDLIRNPPEGIKLFENEDSVSNIYAAIEGPGGTPYEGGYFRIMLKMDRDFPHSPPKGYFLTKIFHPNVSSKGEICVNTLKKDWKPELGIKHILLTIKCLLIVPNPESALNEEAGKLLLECYEDYAKQARLLTSIHAVYPFSVAITSSSNGKSFNPSPNTNGKDVSLTITSDTRSTSEFPSPITEDQRTIEHRTPSTTSSPDLVDLSRKKRGPSSNTVDIDGGIGIKQKIDKKKSVRRL